MDDFSEQLAISRSCSPRRFQNRDKRRVVIPGEEGLYGDNNVGWISMRTLAARRWRVDGGTE